VNAARRYVAEFVGTAFLLMGVVGSGIMAVRLTDDPGLQLFQNAVATGAVLVAVILALGPASGAHLNPAVTIADRVFGGIPNRDAAAYVAAQVFGGIAGTVLANMMFDLSAVTISATARDGAHLFVAEAVATLGLLLVIFGVVRSGHSAVVAFGVGAYITAAYYFTSSTSFANPAVTIARVFTDTFTGIAPHSVWAFLGAQVVGTALAVAVIWFVYPSVTEVADRVVVPHDPA
jgi:arsenate reductase